MWSHLVRITARSASRSHCRNRLLAASASNSYHNQASCLGAVDQVLLLVPQRHFTTTPSSQSPDQLSDERYNHLVDATLDDLHSKLEVLLDDNFVEDSDIELSDGVLKLVLGRHGTYVINKQAPNKQLWMSSPVTGPVRYDPEQGNWVYSRDGHVMHDRLEQELKEVFRDADLHLKPSS